MKNFLLFLMILFSISCTVQKPISTNTTSKSFYDEYTDFQNGNLTYENNINIIYYPNYSFFINPYLYWYTTPYYYDYWYPNFYYNWYYTYYSSWYHYSWNYEYNHGWYNHPRQPHSHPKYRVQSYSSPIYRQPKHIQRNTNYYVPRNSPSNYFSPRRSPSPNYTPRRSSPNYTPRRSLSPTRNSGGRR